jgi:DNA invertase Pin-like site-specific DNA recombinase
MTNTGNLGTIEVTNPVLTVAPLKEDTEMLRATEKITALYCRLSVEDMKDDKNGGKGDVSNSIQNQKDILLRYAKEHRFPNPTFFVDDGYSGTNYDRPGFQQMLSEIEAGKVAVVLSKDCCAIMGLNQKDLENQGILA